MNFWDIQNFNKEISKLKKLSGENMLHPLRQEQIKRELMDRLGADNGALARTLLWQERRHRIFKYVTAVLAGLALVGGTAFASGNALPGQVLFPVKIAKEKIELKLASSGEQRAEIEAKHAQTRIEELKQLDQIAQSSNASSSEPSGVQVQARTEAENEIGNALNSLQQVKGNFLSKGDEDSAKAVQDRINSLQIGALQAHISTFQNNGSNGRQNEGRDGVKDRDNEPGSGLGNSSSTSTSTDSGNNRNGRGSKNGRDSGRRGDILLPRNGTGTGGSLFKIGTSTVNSRLGVDDDRAAGAATSTSASSTSGSKLESGDNNDRSSTSTSTQDSIEKEKVESGR